MILKRMITLLVFAYSGMLFGQTTAIYNLPFSETYKDHTSYDLAISEAWVDEGTFVIRYQVPPELLGFEGRFMTFFANFDVESDFFELICGETGSKGMCTKVEEQIACSVKFRNLNPDSALVDRFLTDRFSGSELQSRQKAAAAFARDAIGTLDIRLTE
jgi:hypothetical protein